MPFEIEKHERLVMLRLTGRVSRNDFHEIAKLAEEIDQAGATAPNRLTDLSGMESIELGFVEMESFARKRRSVRIPHRVRSAIFAPDPLHYGYARMFQTLNDHPDIDIAVFTDWNAALVWVNEPCEQTPEPRIG